MVIILNNRASCFLIRFLPPGNQFKKRIRQYQNQDRPNANGSGELQGKQGVGIGFQYASPCLLRLMTKEGRAAPIACKALPST